MGLRLSWFAVAGLAWMAAGCEPARAQSAPARPEPAYSGTATCASCHAKEHEAWRGSHHDRAMDEANETTVLGNFANARFDAALAEYEAALRFNADRPESHTELGGLQLARGRPDAAVDAYRKALALDPAFAPASVNLADYYRSRGLEREAQDTLAAALKVDPQAAAVHRAIGLSYARQKRMPEALAALGEAARLAPDNARVAYVRGVALHDSGKRAEALKTLERALARHPFDRDILFALASYERAKGDVAKAAQRAKVLVAIDPDNLDYKRFAQDLAAPR